MIEDQRRDLDCGISVKSGNPIAIRGYCINKPAPLDSPMERAEKGKWDGGVVKTSEDCVPINEGIFACTLLLRLFL